MLLEKKQFFYLFFVVSKKNIFRCDTIPSYVEAVTVKNRNYIFLPLPPLLQEIKFVG